MKINDALFGLVLAVLGIVVLVTVQTYPKIPGQNVGPALYPGLVALGLVACGALLIIGGIRRRGTDAWARALPWVRSPRHVARFAALVAAVVTYILLAGPVGFLVVTPLALLGVFLAFGVRPVTSVVVAVVATALIWYAFYKLLRVPLPWGLLERFAF